MLVRESHPVARVSRRCRRNPNHHLWNNNGTWFLHYTVYPTPFAAERKRVSLGTKDLREARSRRDAFFASRPNAERGGER